MYSYNKGMKGLSKPEKDLKAELVYIHWVSLHVHAIDSLLLGRTGPPLLRLLHMSILATDSVKVYR